MLDKQDVSCDAPQPRKHDKIREELAKYKLRLYNAILYRGKDDHEDVMSILLEYRKNLLRESEEDYKILEELYQEKCD